MEWLNIHVSTIRAPEYIGSEPVVRATWVNMLVYCVEQENGGIVAGAAHWKDRQWQQTCGVTLRELRNSEPLVVFQGDDVIVWRYPLEKQAEVQAKREAGARGGRAKAENRQKQDPSTASSSATSTATSTPERSASTEGNGKEGNGKEGNGKELKTASPEALAFADWFLTLTNGKLRLVPNWREQWAKLYDQLVRLDERDPGEVRRVCEWARKDSFWSDNFITPLKLRARDKSGVQYFDVFKARMNARPVNAINNLDGYTMVDPLG